MIESLMDVWRRFSSDENPKPNSHESSFQKSSEESFLAALRVVRKIVRRRSSAPSQQAVEAADLEQGIILRLLDWREKHREKSEKMSESEWESFAARAAYNEINRLYTEGTEIETVSIEEVEEAADQKPIEGFTSAEVYSLVHQVWQEICTLSVRQKRALLFHSLELVLNLLESGIGDAELTRVLELTDDEWSEVKDRLPLSDFQIAELTRGDERGDKNIQLLTKSTKKARYEARGRLQKLRKK